MESSILTAILAVFTAIGDWIVTATTSLQPIFWTGTQLTLLGTLSVCSLAFGVCFLIIGVISKFLKFRG